MQSIDRSSGREYFACSWRCLRLPLFSPLCHYECRLFSVAMQKLISNLHKISICMFVAYTRTHTHARRPAADCDSASETEEGKRQARDNRSIMSRRAERRNEITRTNALIFSCNFFPRRVLPRAASTLSASPNRAASAEEKQQNK